MTRMTEKVFSEEGAFRSALEYWHTKVCREAEIEDFRVHDFRHTCITNWVNNGANIFVVQTASGHKTLAMLKRYYSVSDEQLQSMV